MNEKISLADKLSSFQEHWSPRTIATYNANDIMVVKVEGEFVWHKHDDTDDFFLVLTCIPSLTLVGLASTGIPRMTPELA
jgi:hypothetical protein